MGSRLIFLQFVLGLNHFLFWLAGGLILKGPSNSRNKLGCAILAGFVFGFASVGIGNQLRQEGHFNSVVWVLILSGVLGLLAGLAGRRSGRESVIPWEELESALSRHAGKKVHLAYQLRVDGPNTAARLISQTLDRLGLEINQSGAESDPWEDSKNLPDTDIVVWIYGQGVDRAGNPATLCYTVLHPKSGIKLTDTVFDLRKTTASIMTSIYRCLEEAGKDDGTHAA